MSDPTALILRHLRSKGRKITTSTTTAQTPRSPNMASKTEVTTAHTDASSQESISTEKDVNIEAGQKADTCDKPPGGAPAANPLGSNAPGIVACQGSPPGGGFPGGSPTGGGPPGGGPPGFGGPPIQFPQGIKLYSNILSLYLAGFLTALVGTSVYLVSRTRASTNHIKGSDNRSERHTDDHRPFRLDRRPGLVREQLPGHLLRLPATVRQDILFLQRQMGFHQRVDHLSGRVGGERCSEQLLDSHRGTRHLRTRCLWHLRRKCDHHVLHSPVALASDILGYRGSNLCRRIDCGPSDRRRDNATLDVAVDLFHQFAHRRR